ncbi:MAG TPA: ribonuclease III [Candidatus Aquilonibacter sp.]|nr:ribonuclease III [Candidatus Aquilonibacter sp.]
MGTERTKSHAIQPSPERRGRASAARSATPHSSLEQKIGYRFSKPALLELALTHRSHPYEARTNPADIAAHETKNTPGTDNEQLEFVGDAVLGLAVTELLFKRFSDRSEGELTRMRASLVSRQRMAALGIELGLDQHLLVGRSAEQNGARRKPALLANAAEALMAAIYLDANAAGKDGFREVRRLVEQRLVKPELSVLEAAIKMDGGRGALRDAKTILQERIQAQGAGRLRYADIEQTGPAHQRRFKVEARLESPSGKTAILATAEGASKKEAQQRAAEIALKHWKEPLSTIERRGEGQSEDAA